MSNPDIPQYRGSEGTPGQSPDRAADPPRFAKLKAATVGILAVELASWLLNIASILTGATRDAAFGIVEDLPGGDMFTEAEKQGIAEDAGRLSIPQEAFSLILTVGAFALIYLGLRAHKNWARILGIVLAFVSIGFGVLGNVFAATLNIQMGAIGLVSMLLAVISLALLIYWLVLAFSREVRLHLAPSRMR